jgi:hypothetical protein
VSLGVVDATVVAACGGSSSNNGNGTKLSSSGSPKSATAIKPGKPGGKLTVLASADVDYLDPGRV